MINFNDLSMSRFSWRCISVWRRNYQIWLKTIYNNIVTNLALPILLVIGLGAALSQIITSVNNIPYLLFVSTGLTMFIAAFTAANEIFSAEIRQGKSTLLYPNMLLTPLNIEDIINGEILWCAFLSTLYGLVFALIIFLSVAPFHAGAIWLIPVMFLIGLCFASLSMAVVAFCQNKNLLISVLLACLALLLVSGVFHPLAALPKTAQLLINLTPIPHSLALIRPLMTGENVNAPLIHIVALCVYLFIGYYLSVVLFRHRLSH